MSRKLGNTEQTLAYFCCTFHVAYICDLDSLCGVLFDCLKTVIKKSQNLLLSDFRPRCLRLSLLSVIIIPGHLHGRWLSATELSHSLLFVSGTVSRHMSALYLRHTVVWRFACFSRSFPRLCSTCEVTHQTLTSTIYFNFWCYLLTCHCCCICIVQ